MNFHKLLIFSASTIFLGACNGNFFDQTIDIDPPAYDKQLVMHSVLSDQDSTLEIVLSRNFGILETVKDADWYISGATVEWWADGEKILTLTPDADSLFIYRAALPPGNWSAGKQYEIRINHPDYPDLSGIQVLPAPPEVDSIRVRTNIKVPNDPSEFTAIDVYLQDPAGIQNYYEIYTEVLQYEIDYEFDEFGNILSADTTGVYFVPVYAADSQEGAGQRGINGSILFTDELFDGESFKMTQTVYNNYYGDPDYVPVYRVRIRNITRDYYLYSLTTYRNAEVGGTPLAEPVTIYGNLINGIGVFGLSAEKSVIIE